VIDIDQLPGVIALVFKSAFNMEAGFELFLV
jgi:AGCS family alanine or glycine:cation symporter